MSLDNTFDFEVYDTRPSTFYAGSIQLGFEIEANGSGFIDLYYWDAPVLINDPKSRLGIDLRFDYLVSGYKIQVRSKTATPEAPLKLTVKVKDKLVEDPSTYDNNWGLLAGETVSPPLPGERIIKIQFPSDGPGKGLRPKPVDSVMVSTGGATKIQEPLFAGSTIFTNGNFMSISASTLRNGEARGKYYLFLEPPLKH